MGKLLRLKIVFCIISIAVFLGFGVVSSQETERQAITAANVGSVGEWNHFVVEGKEWVNGLAFSPDTSLLAVGGSGSDVQLWDTTAGELVATFDPDENHVDSLAFSSDGRLLAIGEGDILFIWDVQANKELFSVRGSAYFPSMAFSPDGSVLAAGSFERIVLLDSQTGEELKVLEVSTDFVTDLAFSPDSARLASAGWDGNLRLWDVGSGKELDVLERYGGLINAVAFNHDGTLLASGNDYGSIRLRNTRTGELVANLAEHRKSVRDMMFSSDSTYLVSGGDDFTLRFWSVPDGEPLAVLETETEVKSVAFSPDGTLIATAGSGNLVQLWAVVQAPTGESTETPAVTGTQESEGVFVPQQGPWSTTGNTRNFSFDFRVTENEGILRDSYGFGAPSGEVCVVDVNSNEETPINDDGSFVIDRSDGDYLAFIIEGRFTSATTVEGTYTLLKCQNNISGVKDIPWIGRRLGN